VQIPVIMVTARDDSEMLATTLEAGASDYVRKPLDSVELLARINSALKLAMYMEEHRNWISLKWFRRWWVRFPTISISL